jgi:hypothetical protein
MILVKFIFVKQMFIENMVHRTWHTLRRKMSILPLLLTYAECWSVLGKNGEHNGNCRTNKNGWRMKIFGKLTHFCVKGMNHDW